ncbi:subtilase family protein, partial [Vibrio parahaemolyticus V-223/04]
TGLQTKH